MIIDIHRHMWSSSQRHPAVRKIAHEASKLRYRQPDEIPLVPDVDATSDEIVAEMEREVRLRDADYVKYWMASGPPTTWDDTRIDLKPHERVVAEGDFMCFCSYVIYKGY